MKPARLWKLARANLSREAGALGSGDRGEIGWVDKWFDAEKKPKEWIAKSAPEFIEAGQKIGPLMSGAEWKHDGVAIYYSHASIQLGWIMDASSRRDGEHH